MIFETVLTVTLVILVALLCAIQVIRHGVTVRPIYTGGAIGLGILIGPRNLAVSFLWWHLRFDWEGTYRKGWAPTRPIRKGEIQKGRLYDHTIARGLSPGHKAAARDKYNEFSPKHEKNRKKGWFRKWLDGLRQR